MQFTFLCFNRSDRWVDVPWTSRDITKVFIDSNELVIGKKTAKSDVYEHNVQIEIAKKKNILIYTLPQRISRKWASSFFPTILPPVATIFRKRPPREKHRVPKTLKLPFIKSTTCPNWKMGCYHAGQDGMENENSCFFTAFVEHYVKNKIMRDHKKKKTYHFLLEWKHLHRIRWGQYGW